MDKPFVKLVLLRHGQSTFNKEHEFTGWTDVDLTHEGLLRAKRSGEILRAHGFLFDEVHTSMLRRAIKTMWNCLDQLELEWIPTYRTWRLNERHYGALQETNKDDMTEEMGAEQVKIWRRSFDVAPPELDENDERHPKHDPRYRSVTAPLPGTESLKDCIKRVLPYWHEQIVPELKEGKKVLIVAHGNSLRALIKHLDSISDEEITGLNIPTATPLVYELDADLKPIKHYYLGNQEEIKKAQEAVAHEGAKAHK